MATPAGWSTHDEIQCPCGQLIHTVGFRPIRLADILITLEKQATNPDDYIVLCNGRIGQDGAKYWRKWNLQKDSLDEQEGIVINFLHHLLCA